jgi:hypothetical protein
MSLTPPDLLATLTARIAKIVNARLPKLATCKGISGRLDLEALKRSSPWPAPAVLISRIGAGQAETLAGPVHVFDLQMAAFVVTTDKLGLLRDEANAVIVQELLRIIPGNTWGLPDFIGGASNVTETLLVTAQTEGSGLALTGVTWTQNVGLTDVPDAPIVPIELYVSISADAPYVPFEVTP